MNKNTKINFIIVIILLAVFGGYYFIEYKSQESYILYYWRAVPDIELGYGFTFNKDTNISSGSLTGFVAFNNKEDQPRGARQYYRIDAKQSFDEEGYQIFSVTDTMKLSSIPPREIGTASARAKTFDGVNLVIEDEYGNNFTINTKSYEVTLIDANYDTVTLITSQSDFKDFIVDFSK